MLWAASTASASRVNSSTMLRSLMRRRSAVSSNWKSRAHTSLGRWARSRAAVPSVSRRRLALRCGGRCRRSSRQTRRVRLGLVTSPSRCATTWALRHPSRGWQRAKSRRCSRRRASASSGGALARRWVERCCPSTRHARRSETPNRCWTRCTRDPPTVRGHHFPSASSLSIALSSSASANSFLSRPFSTSSSLRRLAWPGLIPA